MRGRERDPVAHPASLQPATHWKDPFSERTAKGLFSTPWLEIPSDEGIAAVHSLSETLVSTPAHRDDLSVVLGHLLAVHGHCQLAARTRDPVSAASTTATPSGSARSPSPAYTTARAGPQLPSGPGRWVCTR